MIVIVGVFSSLGANEFEGGWESDVDRLFLLLLICCVILYFRSLIEN